MFILQGDWTQIDTFQTNDFPSLNDILTKEIYFWGPEKGKFISILI